MTAVVPADRPYVPTPVIICTLFPFCCSPVHPVAVNGFPGSAEGPVLTVITNKSQLIFNQLLSALPLMHKTSCADRFLPANCQVVVNRVSCLPACSHGENDGCRTGDNISTGPDAFLGCLAGTFVGNDITPVV